jgi:dienelactone hydrolase
MTIVSENVRYRAADLSMHGRLFRDAGATSPLPGALVYPDGFGIGEHAYEVAERLAGLGYVALACDLYGEAYCSGGPCPEVKARNDRISVDPGLFRAIATTPYELLRNRPEVDGARIVAAGYCFGGALGLDLAFTGAEVAAVASFHPSFRVLSLPEAGKARGRLHLFVGAEDYAAPPEARAELEAAFAGQGVRWRMTLYGGVKHAFTTRNCEGMGDKVAYDAEADRDSWAQSLAMFDAALREAPTRAHPASPAP